jgi:hypothetical protein
MSDLNNVEEFTTHFNHEDDDLLSYFLSSDVTAEDSIKEDGSTLHTSSASMGNTASPSLPTPSLGLSLDDSQAVVPNHPSTSSPSSGLVFGQSSHESQDTSSSTSGIAQPFHVAGSHFGSSMDTASNASADIDGPDDYPLGGDNDLDTEGGKRQRRCDESIRIYIVNRNAFLIIVPEYIYLE